MTRSDVGLADPIWLELVALAEELTAWTQMLALDGHARRWEPKRLRLGVFSAAGRLVKAGPLPAAGTGPI